MDKFGIFKLLNSFFNFCEQSKSTSTPQENKGGGSFADLFSAFTPPQNQPSTQPSPSQNTTDKKTTDKVSPPLQASMLSVMNTHDEFIKRVKNKNNK